MKTPLSLLPDSATLAGRLTSALNRGGSISGVVTILERKLPRMMSTFPNEIVTCSLPDGRKRRLFIKYEAGRNHHAYGHRGDVAYEAKVYRRVLDAMPDFRPKCLGVHSDALTGDTWLILEYAYRSVRMSDISYMQATRQPRAMAESARWIALLHATHESRVSNHSLAFLKRYDAEYYRGWAQRTFEFARPLQQCYPWLADLRGSGDAWFAPLLATAPTIIHGEFYAKTVLMRAIGWPRKLVRRCESEYQRARWPEGAPTDFRRTLDASKIYLHFRWLGERPDWTVREKTLWRYEHLRAAAKRLGLI